jgi:hypothetical protein
LAGSPFSLTSSSKPTERRNPQDLRLLSWSKHPELLVDGLLKPFTSTLAFKTPASQVYSLGSGYLKGHGIQSLTLPNCA